MKAERRITIQLNGVDSKPIEVAMTVQEAKKIAKQLLDAAESLEAQQEEGRTMLVTMLQGWQDCLADRLRNILGKHSVLGQGYGDSSTTTWVVAVTVPDDWDAKRLDKALRAELGGFGGWLKVKEHHEEEEEDLPPCDAHTLH